MLDRLFDLDPWALRHRGLSTEHTGVLESLLALGNGALGIRGSLDEGDPGHARGTFIAGVHEEHPLSYPEDGYGNPDTGQAIIPVADGSLIRALVDGSPLRLGRGCLDHSRTLDLRAGTLQRETKWRTRSGGTVSLTSTRLVALDRPGVAAIRYRLAAGDKPARVVLRSELVVNGTDSEVDNDDPRVGDRLGKPFEAHIDRVTDCGGLLVHRTRNSAITVAASVHHEVSDNATCLVEHSDDLVAVDIVADLEPGESVEVIKFLGYAWLACAPGEQMAAVSAATLADARERGWDGLVADQRAALDGFWEHALVEIEGDPELEQALRFDLFQLLQASAMIDDAPMGAKGLTGSGYAGHTFWDIEGFVLPALSCLRPDAADRLLAWRAGTLPQARGRAEILGLDGAAFAWRTINGHEASGYWPASSAAQHLNAAIARAIVLHAHITGRDLHGAGLTVLFETARAWAGMGHYDHQGRWHLFGMTGPDEYTGVVDDNTFTNLMAAQHLRWAVTAATTVPEAAEASAVTEDETAAWAQAARSVYVPWDEVRRVHPACENFTTFGEWDFENGPHVNVQGQAHYAKIYRRQVVKQADLVQALWWCEDAFTDEEIARDFDYYERRTVRDSSLSAGVQGVVAARTGHLDLAYSYLRTAALVDLRDIQGDTDQGLHLASLAGAWHTLVAGLGGMREGAEVLTIAPRLPERLSRIMFRLCWQGRVISIDIGRAATTVTLMDGRPVEIVIDGESCTLGDKGLVRPLRQPEPLLDPPVQPPGRSPSI
ncbi:glycoside hydrolase family 65 protein [Granulicoccus sp. GXG6511]|uniref:glycoside hydrolase family 65 protein n=1 Tax=Granulicoccus sp. GXG6511 TaxID=3381351 RepID=UPI003D7E4B3A